MGFSYRGDQDTSPGNYWDTFLGPSRSPGSVLIIFLIIIIIVCYSICLLPPPALTYERLFECQVGYEIKV